MEVLKASLANYIRQEGHKIKVPPEDQLDINTSYRVNKATIEKGTVKRCTKVFLKPNPKQADKLRNWFIINDKIYNLAVNHLKMYQNIKIPMIGQATLRNEVKQLIVDKYPQLQYLIKKYQFPVDTRDCSIEEARINYRTARSVRKFRAFRIRCRKLNKPKKTMAITEKAFSKSKNTMFPTLLGILDTIGDVQLGEITSACDLQWNSRGKHKFTLFIPEDRLIIKPVARKPSCALDPGAAIFQTLYDGDKFIKIAENTRARVQLQYDKLEKVKHLQQTKWYDKFSGRVWDKIKHTIEDVHNKVSTWLCRNYSEIAIGKISTSSILKKEGLAPKHKQMLQQMSHFSFRQTLKHKAELYSSKVYEINEAYTSKMCGNCAELNIPNSNRLYSCKCGYEINRDFNGARNISFRRVILT